MQYMVTRSRKFNCFYPILWLLKHLTGYKTGSKNRQRWAPAFDMFTNSSTVPIPIASKENLSLVVIFFVSSIFLMSINKSSQRCSITKFSIYHLCFSAPHWFDRDSKGDGILLYVRDRIIVLPLNRYSLPPSIEILFFELNLSNRKLLTFSPYNPHKILIKKTFLSTYGGFWVLF